MKISTSNMNVGLDGPPLQRSIFLLAFGVAALTTSSCHAQSESHSNQTIHPWLYCNADIPRQPCALGYFCGGGTGNLTGSVCQKCPPLNTSCEVFDSELTLTELGLDECHKFCDFGGPGEDCGEEDICDPGNSYCDFSSINNNGTNTGTCQACPDKKVDCLREATVEGQQDCLESCDLNCWPLVFPYASVEGIGEVGSLELRGATGASVEGPIVDCTNLIFDNEDKCEGAEGSVCLIEDETKDLLNYEAVLKCEKSGGVAAVLFGNYPEHRNGEGTLEQPFIGTLNFVDTQIPSISISHNDGTNLRKNFIGKNMNVTIEQQGEYCWKDLTCSDDIPCLGTYEGRFCNYDFGEHGGWCWVCPTEDVDDDTAEPEPDPVSCFFDNSGEARTKLQPAVASCAETCAASLEFATCKFCPQDVDPLTDFGVENPEDRCEFCPENDILYPDREVRFFGKGIKCWQMQSFFSRMDIHKDSQNCQLAQTSNYVCGCQGPGYGGADTTAKQKALVWLPRVMAILSFMGSLFIVYDAFRVQNRDLTIYQLMMLLSTFDSLGSLGYMLTSLPMPKEDYIYGSQGNEDSCTAQGFFIQLGTISCYTNLSLAIYFYFVIKKGWTELHIKRIRPLLFLLPLAVGFAFAFAGIPFYDTMILWCNNTARWWPEIPVALTIFVASVLMCAICIHVYVTEKTASRWSTRGTTRGPTRGASGRSMSQQVFWQCFWYLVAFYLTWVPYITLQYLWADGNYFQHYGFILFAGTMMPLQGFWNFFVYIRPRYLPDIASSITSSITRHSKNASAMFKSGKFSSTRDENEIQVIGKVDSKRKAEEDKEMRNSDRTHTNSTHANSSNGDGSAPLRGSSQSASIVEPFSTNLDPVPEPPMTEEAFQDQNDRNLNQQE